MRSTIRPRPGGLDGSAARLRRRRPHGDDAAAAGTGGEHPTMPAEQLFPADCKIYKYVRTSFDANKKVPRGRRLQLMLFCRLSRMPVLIASSCITVVAPGQLSCFLMFLLCPIWKFGASTRAESYV